MSETIQHFIDSGDTMMAQCGACRHSAALDMAALARRLGPQHGCLHDDLVPLLTCSRCGARGHRLGLIRQPRGHEERSNIGGAHRH